MKTIITTAFVLLIGIGQIFANPTHVQSAKPSGTCVACATPSGLAASNQTGTTALLSWAAVAGAGSYNIEVEDASGNPNNFAAVATVSTTSYTVTGLLPNLSYKFKVRSRCGGSKSNWSAWFTFNSSAVGNGGGGNGGGGACSTPGGMAQLAVTTTTATLGWNAVPGVTGYRINIENAAGNPFPLNLTVNLPSSSTSHTVTGLVPGRAYKWKVRSLCGTQTSAWSALKTFTTPLNLTGGGLDHDDFTGAADLKLAELTAYPNPTTGELTVAFAGNDGPVELKVVNLTGQTVFTQQAAANEQMLLDLGTLPNGIFMLAAQNGSVVKTQKISINR